MLKKTIFIFCVLTSCIIKAQFPTFAWVDRTASTGSPFNSIAVDASGSVYATGAFGGIVDFDPGPATYTLNAGPASSAYITKMDAAGNFVWAKQITGIAAFSYVAGTGIEVDAAGNIFASGYFYSICDFDPGPGLYNLSAYNATDVFVCKWDAGGNFVWAKSFGHVGWDNAHGMALDNNSNVLVTGEFYFTPDFDPGPGVYNMTAPNNTADCFIWKLDSAGNFMWARKIGGPGTSSSTTGDIGREIAVDPLGNVLTVGTFDTIVDFDPGPLTYTIAAKYLTDGFVSKLDANGNFVWASSVGSNTATTEECRTVAVDGIGNVYTAGNFFGTTDLDPGPGTYTLSTSTSGGYFRKLDPLGNLIWVKEILTGSQSICIDPSGNLCSSGTFGTNTDFDPGPGTFTIGGFGGACVNMLDANGNFVWAGKIADYNYGCGYEIVSDNIGNIYTTGYFYGTHDFDPGPGTYTLTSIAGYDAFTHKLNWSVLGVSQAKEEEILLCTIFPNPNNGSFVLEVKKELKNAEIQILNSLGQIIFVQKVEVGTNSIHCSGLSQGIYQYILFENKVKVGKGKILIE